MDKEFSFLNFSRYKNSGMKILLSDESVEAAVLPFLEKLTIFVPEYERTSDSGQKRGKPFPALKVA